MRARAENRIELGGEGLPDRAVDTIGADQQIAIVTQSINIGDLMIEEQSDAELLRTLLQDLEQPQPRDAGEAVSVNGDLLVAVNDIDIIPGGKLPSDRCMRLSIDGAQVAERAARENHAPAEGTVRSVAFEDRDLVGGTGSLHEDGEVETCGTATDDVDLHSY